jgi:YD repeat-containing protein
MYITVIKNYVKTVCCAMMILIISTKGIAQNTLVPKIVPPSPEAASLGKFVEVPVSHYTGLPTISVPLYTIESGEINLPIQVSYHARGVQVSEMASQVGIGWALNAGGVITRQQRGAADESNHGYLTENFYDTFFTSQTTRQRVYDWSLTGIDSDNIMDMEPDVFMFNFLNFSGKFIFDQKTKLPVIQKYSDFKIVPIYQAAGNYTIKGWIITDKDGIQYYFGTSKDGSRTAIDKPQASSSYQFLSQGGLQTVPSGSGIYNNAWQLMDIVTPSNKQIKFEYAKDQPNYFSRGYDDGPISALNCHFSRVIMDQYHIKTITFDKGKVVFTKFTTEREDLRYSYALQKIEVLGTDNIVKVKHTFNYTYTNSEDTNVLFYLRTTELQAKKRMFLESILSEGSPSETSKSKKHSFVYDPQVLPNRFSTAQDAWGYYNAKPNGEYSSFFEGDDRRVDTIASQAGMLKKIIYPTGGSASFEYEHNIVIAPNFYKELLLNATTPVIHQAISVFKDGSLYSNGLYSKTFTVYDPNPDKVFTINSNTIFGGTTTSCSTTSNNANCPFEVAVYKVSPRTFMGSLYIGRGFVLLKPGDYVLEYKPKTAAGRNPDDYETDAFSVTLSWEQEPILQAVDPSNKILFAAGKRIKRIVWDDNLGGITSKTYKYLDSSGESSGTTFSIPNMYYIERMVNDVPVVSQMGATAGSPLTNFQGNALGYSIVTEINGEAGNNIGKTEYTFTMPLDAGGAYYKFPYYPPIDNEWLRGMPLNIKYYSNNAGTYSLVKTVVNQYIYGDMMTDVRNMAEMLDIDGYLMHRRKFIFPMAFFSLGVSASGSINFSDVNSYRTFYTMGGTVDLFSSEETEILKNAKEHKKTTNYFYNYDSNYQLKRSQTKSSSQETLETKYFYASDPEMASEPFRSELNAKFMIGIPLDTQTFNNGAKLSEQKTVYDNSAATSNLLLPRYIYSNKGVNNITEADKKITFDKYDDKGNILQYTPEGGLPVSIIWGYNKTQPIAKVENSTYDQIAGYVLNLQNLSDADDDNCMGSSCKEEILRASLKSLRESLSNSMVSTYTYNPLVGVTSTTDAKGFSSYYEYDSLGRLKFVKDKDLNVLEKYCYNYKGEQTDCSDNTSTSVVLYKSSPKSGSFTRNNCEAGGSGATVIFNQAAGTVTSTISQADADEKALDKFTIEGQAFANDNANAKCTFQSAALSGSFQKDNCSVGGVGSYVNYSLPAGAVTLTTSQADVDSKALAQLNTEGKANANASGDCTFRSGALSGSFQKNNCTVGGVGSYVSYSLPVGAITLNSSQADVDAKALTKLNTEGLANANASGDCTFRSGALSGSFQKNNCTVGGVGSYVSYSLPVGAITLNTSQADVDAKALVKLNTEGLANANANANGFCTFRSVAISGSFQKDNCPAGGTGSYVSYSLATGAVTLNTSQADVDAQALAQLNTQGKANANTYGSCTFYNVAKSGNFTRNNCVSGAFGSFETYIVTAGSYSGASQAEADNNAQDRVNSYGQIYANQVGRCVFKSVAKSKTLTKNDCSAGGTGSVGTYSLPAGAYSSEESQAAADKKAQDVVDAIAQSYVNDNGTCTFYSAAKSGSFTKNNCAAGTTTVAVVYSVPAGRYTSTGSQAAADSQAQDDVNNNGQAYANANGVCTQAAVYSYDYTYSSGSNNMSIVMRCSVANHPAVTFNFIIYYTSKTNSPSFLRKSFVLPANQTTKNEPFTLSAIAGSISLELTGPVQ